MKKNSKQKAITKIVTDQVYRRDLLFVIGPFSAVRKTLKRFKITDPDLPEDVLGLVKIFEEKDSYRIRGKVLFMWIKNHKDFYTLMHEVTHLCIKIFDLSNMSVEDTTSEAFAFYHEYWFKKLWIIMSKK